MYISRDDYEEPRCPLCMPEEVRSIPVGRVIEKLDEYLSRNDYAAAERHLKHWLMEAEDGGDERGRLTVLNEMIGLYRKAGRESEGLETIRKALAVLEGLDMRNTPTEGTTLVNAATGLKAFGRPEEALPLYERAREVYEAQLEPEDERLGGLYNNMALALLELQDFRAAETLFLKAMSVMEKQPHGEGEMAITWLNLADLAAAELGLTEGEERIGECLEKAETLLDTATLPRDGNYAFICEKCASVFGYYGWFFTEQTLTARAEEIYGRGTDR